ncbi:homeobox protein cut [Vespula squamosa]|uniref:Homeobox protein cut n=1 Tax=Vespula squamosa TaxID=30214 RepID=A0ABD1ZUT3_VESSQ
MGNDTSKRYRGVPKVRGVETRTNGAGITTRGGWVLWRSYTEYRGVYGYRYGLGHGGWSAVRATLAEKEVSALKEQLATTSDGNSKTEGHHSSQTSQGSDQQQQHDASNPRRTPNTNLEQELQAKDKESIMASRKSLNSESIVVSRESLGKEPS